MLKTLMVVLLSVYKTFTVLLRYYQEMALSVSNPPLNKIENLIATWFGCGLMKPAPGTWGSLGAVPFAFLIFGISGFWGFIATIIIMTPIGFWATAKYEASSGIHDNKQIVIDEVVGQWIAFIPVFYVTSTLEYGMGLMPLGISIVLAFILFRIFDITKPWPISHFDKNVKGATGVMVDDIIAGLFAAIIISGGLYARYS
ncbi:MAG: phosphatidylglycerophosphatase A [Bdellovibrionales bacterium]